MSEDAVAIIWRRRVAWSRAADRVKASIAYARGAALALSASGAVLETVAGTLLADAPTWRTTFAALGAVLLALATFVATRFVTTDAIRTWIRARSVSEAIKAEVYAYRAAAEPYSGPKAVAILQQKVSGIEGAARDLERHVAAIAVVTALPPPPLAPADYIEKRVRQQVEVYYRPKARLYARRLAAFRLAELLLGLVAAVLGALAAFISGSQQSANPGIAAWVAVFTTLGAALAAHMGASRYDFLVTSFYATARRLEDLVGEWRAEGSPTAPEAWTDFVRACEEAISIENESWLAKWAEQEVAK